MQRNQQIMSTMLVHSKSDYGNSLQQDPDHEPESGSFADLLAGLDDYRLTHPKEIYAELRQLATRADFVSISFGQNGLRIVSRLLYACPEEEQVYYDLASTPFENTALLASREQLFSATPNGVHVQFVCADVTQRMFDGAPAFCCPYPAAVYRMQRRENFRIETPVARPFMCHAMLPDGSRFSFELADISVTGVRLRSAEPRLEMLKPGTLFSDAVIDCQNLGSIATDLRVAFVRNMRTETHPLYQIGCRFDNLQPRRENELQRMITTLELRRNRR